MRVDSHTQIRQAMRVDSHTQIRQAMRVLIHTHISCRLLVEGNAPKPLSNTEFHSVATHSTNAFLSVPCALFRGIGVRESLTPFANMVLPKIGLPLEDGVVKCHPGFPFRDGCDGRNGAGSTPQNTVATVASVALYSITSNAGASTTM